MLFYVPKYRIHHLALGLLWSADMHQIASSLRHHNAKRWRGSRGFLIACAILLIVQNVYAQQQFGYVLDARGDWFLNGNASQKLSKGSALPAGGMIGTPAPSERGSYIVVADRNGQIFDRRQCSNPGECDRPIRLPKSVSSRTSLLSRIIGAAMSLVSEEPGKYASFSSRSAELQDAVVKLIDDRVDLRPVFKDVQGGRYLLQFEQIRRKSRAGAATPLKPFDFDWDPNQPSSLLISGLAPGLHKVSLLERQGEEHEPTGAEAWVLISGPSGYEKAASSFQDAVMVTKQWGTKVKQTAVREFLRAALDYIATAQQTE